MSIPPLECLLSQASMLFPSTMYQSLAVSAREVYLSLYRYCKRSVLGTSVQLALLATRYISTAPAHPVPVPALPTDTAKRHHVTWPQQLDSDREQSALPRPVPVYAEVEDEGELSDNEFHPLSALL